MSSINLDIFSNFFIDNEERLIRMKDSFRSFAKINPNKWVINIRGSLKYQAGNFLRKELGGKLQLFYLNSNFGWFYDSKIIFKNINSNYVMFWIEDHILTASINDFYNCLLELEKSSSDQIIYSFFSQHNEKFKNIKSYKKGRYITTYKLEPSVIDKITNSFKKDTYLVSCLSIMKKDFFQKVLYSSRPILKRWSRKFPFDFEKKASDKLSDLILYSIPNKELFACIDDDHGDPGSSLVSRGYYPNRMSRESLKKIEFGYSLLYREKLKNLLPKTVKLILLELYYFARRIFYTINIFWNK